MNEITKWHDGIRCTKNSDGNLVLELDHDGAWWVAMALQSAEKGDAGTDKIMGFVCDNFQANGSE